jgi:hypothetical protein
MFPGSQHRFSEKSLYDRHLDFARVGQLLPQTSAKQIIPRDFAIPNGDQPRQKKLKSVNNSSTAPVDLRNKIP